MAHILRLRRRANKAVHYPTIESCAGSSPPSFSCFSPSSTEGSESVVSGDGLVVGRY